MINLPSVNIGDRGYISLIWDTSSHQYQLHYVSESDYHSITDINQYMDEYHHQFPNITIIEPLSKFTILEAYSYQNHILTTVSQITMFDNWAIIPKQDIHHYVPVTVLESINIGDKSYLWCVDAIGDMCIKPLASEFIIKQITNYLYNRL